MSSTTVAGRGDVPLAEPVRRAERTQLRRVHVLAYGKAMAFHGIHCHAVSPKLGIRCVNAVGHGFRMGGGTWRLF